MGEIPKLNPEIEAVLRDKGENWLIAAMVDGSIGYHSPGDARRLIAQYKDGARQCGLERCIACFGWDLEKMILWDIHRFTFLDKNAPELVKRRTAYIDAWAARPEDPFDMTGLMYPTQAL
jgi:hypothetical protein